MTLNENHKHGSRYRFVMIQRTVGATIGCSIQAVPCKGWVDYYTLTGGKLYGVRVLHNLKHKDLFP